MCCSETLGSLGYLGMDLWSIVEKYLTVNLCSPWGIAYCVILFSRDSQLVLCGHYEQSPSYACSDVNKA